MADLIELSDVEANYRSLRGQEITNVTSWIKAASAELHVRVAGLDVSMAASADYAQLVKDTVVLAVLRRLHWRATDATPWNWFSSAEIDRLVNPSLDAGTGLPSGSFPAVCAYPVF